MTTATPARCPKCIIGLLAPDEDGAHCLSCGLRRYRKASETLQEARSGDFRRLRPPRTGPRSYRVPYTGDAFKLRSLELVVVTASERIIIPLCPWDGAEMEPTGQMPPGAKRKRSKSWYGCKVHDHRIVLLKDAYGEALGWS